MCTVLEQGGGTLRSRDWEVELREGMGKNSERKGRRDLKRGRQKFRGEEEWRPRAGVDKDLG